MTDGGRAAVLLNMAGALAAQQRSGERSPLRVVVRWTGARSAHTRRARRRCRNVDSGRQQLTGHRVTLGQGLGRLHRGVEASTTGRTRAAATRQRLCWTDDISAALGPGSQSQSEVLRH